MTIEEAIGIAIEYEEKVRDAYRKAVEGSADDVGRRIFGVLGDEEQGHIDYLRSRLDEWRRTGRVTEAELATVVPLNPVLELQAERPERPRRRDAEVELLERALALETETSTFFRRMVEEMGEEGRLFTRFLEIEEGHQAVVQAEIDCVSRTGYYYDFPEFSLEM